MSDRIYEEIKKKSGEKPVKVFFDMDGVLAEYNIDKNGKLDENISGYYAGSRPVKTAIKYAKHLSKLKNVEVCVLSACKYKLQAKDKVKWLAINCPFIKKENIKILCYESVKFEKEDKYNLKTRILENIAKDFNGYIYHIDDDVRIIKSMKKSDVINVVHVISIIK